MGDDLDSWLADSNLYKRTFRNCAIIAGLIQRRFPNKGKVRTPGDIFFRPYLRRPAGTPDPTMCCCARLTGMQEPVFLDIARLGDMLARVKKRIVTRRLERVSPLAVPALLEAPRNGCGRRGRSYPAGK
ncbi:MAG: hypothetical protein U1E93_09265 [Alphaproteobacteria bacterium]